MNPDILLVGDMHLYDDQPKCRKDALTFDQTTIRKLKWLRSIWEETGRPLLIQSGDLFHRWKCSPWVISTVLEHCPPMITIPGNPGQHNADASQFDKDALYTLKVAGKGWIILDNGTPLKLDKIVVYPCLWGKEPVRARREDGKRNILVTHRMVLDGPSPFQGDNKTEFLTKHRSYDLLLTGHNHQPFMDRVNGRILVNPGSFIRRTIDEDHRPRIYKYWVEANEIEPVFVPIEEGIITTDHLKKETDQDSDRMESFLEMLKTAGSLEMTVRFKENMQLFLEANEESLREGLQERIKEAIGE